MANQYSLNIFKKAEHSGVVSRILPNTTYSLNMYNHYDPAEKSAGSVKF